MTSAMARKMANQSSQRPISEARNPQMVEPPQQATEEDSGLNSNDKSLVSKDNVDGSNIEVDIMAINDDKGNKET